MSLGARLVNVFVSPGEVFDDIKSRPYNPVNWLVPAVLSIIVGIVFTFVVFSQPQIVQGMKEAQEKQMQQMVDKGIYTRQQADQGQAMMEKFFGPTAMKIIWTLMMFIVVPAKIAFIAFLVWGIGRVALKTPFDYAKATEVVGLCAAISVIDMIVRTLLAVIYSNASMSLGPALFVPHFNPQNPLHGILAFLDIFLFWQIGVWSLGLAKLSGQSFAKSLAWLGACLLALAGTCFGTLMFMNHLLARLGGK